jgi:hypothetical protein
MQIDAKRLPITLSSISSMVEEERKNINSHRAYAGTSLHISIWRPNQKIIGG